MRIALLLLLAIALPVSAAPQDATHATPPATSTPHGAHSPIGEVMGSLTRALREAAAQQAHATAPAGPASAPASPSRVAADQSPTPLPPDATAQAAVP